MAKAWSLSKKVCVFESMFRESRTTGTYSFRIRIRPLKSIGSAAAAVLQVTTRCLYIKSSCILTKRTVPLVFFLSYRFCFIILLSFFKIDLWSYPDPKISAELWIWFQSEVLDLVPQHGFESSNSKRPIWHIFHPKIGLRSIIQCAGIRWFFVSRGTLVLLGA